MKLTKKDYVKSLDYICDNCEHGDCCFKECMPYKRLEELIEEHFDCPKLSNFEIDYIIECVSFYSEDIEFDAEWLLAKLVSMKEVKNDE